MKRQAGSIEPSELREVAGLVKQAAEVIDQMFDLNKSIDIAASSAIKQYRADARVAEEALNRIVAGTQTAEADREQMIATQRARIAELEALVAKQQTEIEALRMLLWPKGAGPNGGALPLGRTTRK